MKHSIKRISKSALSVILALMMVVSTMVVGMVTVNALYVQNGAILFFDNSKTNWTGNIYFSVGQENNSTYYKMSKVANSNIYYLSASKYDSATYFAFFASSQSNLTGESTGYSGLASKGSYTGSYSGFDFNSGSCYVITPSGSSNGDSISVEYQSDGYGYFNSKKQTLTMQLQDGDTVTTLNDDSKAVATLKVATYKMTSNTATEAVSSESKSASIANVAAMYTAETTLSYSNLDSGYEFVSWYNSEGTQVGTNTSYTYSASSASSTTYYARFKAASTTETNWYIYGAKWSDSWKNPTTKGQQLSLVDGYTSLYSVTLSGDYLTDFFNFHDGTSQYIPDSGSQSTLNNGSTNKTKIKTGNNVSFKNSSQSFDNVTVYLDASDSSNIYVWYEPAIKKLATPTISFDSTTIAAADGSYVTLTVENHSTYTSLSDVKVSYKLFNGDSEVTTASFDSNGKCQIKEAGTYKVQAVSSDTSKYTNSEYSTATKIEKAAQSVYYIGGRFRVKVDGVYKVIANDWTEKNTDANFKFTLVDGETDLYYLNTNCTLKELSESIGSNTAPQYFKIYDQANEKLYNEQNQNLENCNSYATAQTLSDCGDEKDTNMRFQSTATDGTVTLYLKNDNGTLKLYYSLVGDKTALAAPSIATNNTALSLSNPTATITVTPDSSYPQDLAVEYRLYKDGGSTAVSTTTGTTFTVSAAGTYTVKAHPPADSVLYKESEASTSVEITDTRETVQVKAMNGLTGLGTSEAKAANSSSSVVLDTSSDLAADQGKEYTVIKGSTVTVTTTMTADTTTAEKFVYAYVINNKDTYLATEGIAVTDEEGKKYSTYSATFTIDETTSETTFEVVPIYYYMACAQENKYIKFYVDKSDAENWGAKIYNYAYYYKTQKSESTQESDGSWPGQPMLYDETKQLYYALVPKQINNQPVSGLTVNIGSASLQSFDFDDFKVINEMGYDIVRLDLKERSGHTTRNIDKLVATYSNGTFSATNHPKNISDFISESENRWESFKDINGNDMSLLGKEVSGTKKLYVVSTASHKIVDRGDFMTSWFVYEGDSSGNLTFITAACPSDFIPRAVAANNTAAYNKIVDKGLDTAAVQIVYEDKTTSRIDGRWYYANSDTEVSAYAYYQTVDQAGNPTLDAEGNPTKIRINKEYARINAEEEITDESGVVIGGKNSTLDKDISVVSGTMTGFVFDYWAIMDKSTGTITKKLESLGASFTTTLDQEVHYVAVFKEAAEGTLVINHSKYNGSDAKGGLGFYRLEVQVQRENGNWDTFTVTGNGANGQSIKDLTISQNDKIVKIKLITETSGENSFLYWYTASSNGMEIIEDPDGDMTWKAADSEDYVPITDPTGRNGIVTYTFETEVWKLFSGSTMIINQMNFYSDIAPMTKNYTLTYLYNDRKGNQKSYVVTGTHDDRYYAENGTWEPNQQLIYEKAPYIDDIYKDCKWTMTYCSIVGTEATLVAVQNSKTYTVDIYDASGISVTHNDLALNSYVKDRNTGQFYVADEYITVDETTKYFSYWAVYERIIDSDGTTVKQGKEVARHFYRKFTLAIIDNYIIKPVYGEKIEGNAYISTPQYSREQTRNADGSIKTDKLYVDFMVAYMSADNTLIRDDKTGDKYQTGILIEVDKSVTLPENLNYSGIKFDSNTDKLEEIAKTTKKNNNYDYNETKRLVFNYRATNTKYNNMNRLDCFVSFTNSPANCSYVMKAYYYVIVDGVVTLSEPVYFNLYEVGNSEPNTVETTS